MSVPRASLGDPPAHGNAQLSADRGRARLAALSKASGLFSPAPASAAPRKSPPQKAEGTLRLTKALADVGRGLSSGRGDRRHDGRPRGAYTHQVILSNLGKRPVAILIRDWMSLFTALDKSKTEELHLEVLQG